MLDNNKPVARMGDKTCQVDSSPYKYTDYEEWVKELYSPTIIGKLKYTKRTFGSYIHQYKSLFKYDQKRFMQDILHPIQFYKFVKKTGGRVY